METLPNDLFAHVCQYVGLAVLGLRRCSKGTCAALVGSKIARALRTDQLEEFLMGYRDISRDAASSAFVVQCMSGHLFVAQWILERYEVDVNPDSFRRALGWACRNGDLVMARWLASRGTTHGEGPFALEKACQGGQLSIAR